MDRFAIAHAVVKSGLTKILKRDREGRVTSVLVPGSEGKQYEVILRRGEAGVTTECQLLTGVGYLPCQGGRVTVCKHGLSAILVAAADKHQDIFLCETIKDAKRLKNAVRSSVIVAAKSVKADRTIYLVVKQLEAATPAPVPVSEPMATPSPSPRERAAQLIAELGY